MRRSRRCGCVCADRAGQQPGSRTSPPVELAVGRHRTPPTALPIASRAYRRLPLLPRPAPPAGARPDFHARLGKCRAGPPAPVARPAYYPTPLALALPLTRAIRCLLFPCGMPRCPRGPAPPIAATRAPHRIRSQRQALVLLYRPPASVSVHLRPTWSKVLPPARRTCRRANRLLAPSPPHRATLSPQRCRKSQCRNLVRELKMSSVRFPLSCQSIMKILTNANYHDK